MGWGEGGWEGVNSPAKNSKRFSLLVFPSKIAAHLGIKTKRLLNVKALQLLKLQRRVKAEH